LYSEQILMEEDKDKSQLRKADIIISFVLFAFSVLFLIFALKMPAKIYIQVTGQPSGIYTAPGIFPIFISIILILESMLLFRTGLKGAKRFSVEDIRHSIDYIRTDTFKRLVTVIGLLILYIFILLGRIRYDLATFIYLFSNMVIFRPKKYSILKIFFICVAFSLATAYGFKYLARIPLP